MSSELRCSNLSGTNLGSDSCDLNFKVMDSDDFLSDPWEIAGQSPVQYNVRRLSYLQELLLYGTLFAKCTSPRSRKESRFRAESAAKIQPRQYFYRLKDTAEELKKLGIPSWELRD
jgi:hypothetical protein